jgi:hypothetical protein
VAAFSVLVVPQAARAKAQLDSRTIDAIRFMMMLSCMVKPERPLTRPGS